ncbi:MAG: MFS transporter [Rhodospirillaceae bacterium]
MTTTARPVTIPTAAWVVIAAGAVSVAIAMGVRQSFGIFLHPLGSDLGIGREAFGFAIAIQNLLWGLAQPFVGAVADRWGAARVTIVGTLLYCVGLLVAANAQGTAGLIGGLGLLVGVALSMTTYVTVLGAVGRAVPPERRGLAFGLTTAAGSFGMFAVVPGVQGLIDGFGWREALMLMALGVSALAACAIGLRAPKAVPGAAPQPTPGLPLAAAVKAASRHGGYWLLTAGFFVCGFHVTFIATHLPSYLSDKGMGTDVAALCLAFIGFFNILGSLAFGRLGDRYSKKRVLAVLYMTRAVVIGLFLAAPLSPLSAVLFSAGIGFLWLGTVPLTSGLCAQIFGVRALGTLYGFVFFSHQVGSFFGAWLGGMAYDALGSYDSVWAAAVALGVVAAALHWPINDRPVIAPLEAAKA